MNKTPIEWTDFTVNPFRFRNLETGKVGHHCEKVSPGCKNCYSGKMQTGPYLSGLEFIAENKPKGEFFLDEGVLEQVLRRKKPCRIFWCDMTDMFLADYPDEWIDKCFAVMALTPHLTHQVLTKRACRMWEWARRGPLRVAEAAKKLHTSVTPFVLPSEAVFEADRVARGEQWRIHTWPLPNAWMGCSVEDQQRADERIPYLLQTPAAVRFLSVEPLLGPVDLTHIEFRRATWYDALQDHDGFGLLHAEHQKIDWVIAGGESGPGARPCDIAWIRSIVAQCAAAGVACFCKQLGADPREGNANGNCRNVDCTHPDCGYIRLRLKDRKGGDPEEWPSDLRVQQFPEAK